MTTFEEYLNEVRETTPPTVSLQVAFEALIQDLRNITLKLNDLEKSIKHLDFETIKANPCVHLTSDLYK